MYEALEIRMPDMRVAAVIESINKVRRIKFSEDKLIEDSLQRILSNGIEAVLPKGKRHIVINSAPGDPDFIQKIQQYLTLSFSYICLHKSTELNPELVLDDLTELKSQQSEEDKLEWDPVKAKMGLIEGEPEPQFEYSDPPVVQPFSWMP